MAVGLSKRQKQTLIPDRVKDKIIGTSQLFCLLVTTATYRLAALLLLMFSDCQKTKILMPITAIGTSIIGQVVVTAKYTTFVILIALHLPVSW